MAVREDLVASAAQFLQDPSVAASSTENKMAFLRQKNLTQEEIEAALARTGSVAHAPGPSRPYQPYGSYAWQQAAPMSVEPKRDWRDWFIMATVIGGLSYGLWFLGKRYVYPLIAPPTPERLEQDKRLIEEQFDRAFGLVEQLAKDTEALKASEKLRAERLDTALTELEKTMIDLKSANRRGEDNSQRIREEMQSLKDAIPKALKGQKELTDSRLVEITSELGSFKTLISQRMTAGSGVAAAGYPLRPSPAGGGGDVGGGGGGGEKAEDGGGSARPGEAPNKGTMPSGPGRTPGLNGGGRGRASIPAWQMAAASSSTERSAEGKEVEDAAGTKDEGTPASGTEAGVAQRP